MVFGGNPSARAAEIAAAASEALLMDDPEAMFKDIQDKFSRNTHRVRQTVREQVDHKAQRVRLMRLDPPGAHLKNQKLHTTNRE